MCVYDVLSTFKKGRKGKAFEICERALALYSYGFMKWVLHLRIRIIFHVFVLRRNITTRTTTTT